MSLTRYPEKENVRKFDMKRSADSWTKVSDLRHTLIQYILQQNRLGTGEDETIEKEEDVRRHAGGLPLLTDLSRAMRTNILPLIRRTREFETVIYGPAVTIAFPDVKVDAYRLWAKMDLVPMNMKGKADLQEAALIVTNGVDNKRDTVDEDCTSTFPSALKKSRKSTEKKKTRQLAEANRTKVSRRDKE